MRLRHALWHSPAAASGRGRAGLFGPLQHKGNQTTLLLHTWSRCSRCQHDTRSTGKKRVVVSMQRSSEAWDAVSLNVHLRRIFFPTNHTGWVKLSWLKTILIPDQRDFLQLTLSTLFSEDCNQRVLTYEVSYSSLCASIRLRCNIKPCFDAYPPRLAQVNIYFQTPSVCKRKWESHM